MNTIKTKTKNYIPLFVFVVVLLLLLPYKTRFHIASIIALPTRKSAAKRRVSRRKTRTQCFILFPLPGIEKQHEISRSSNYQYIITIICINNCYNYLFKTHD